MKKTHSRGFTLIELLVVIAIIGILSSVVLASLSTARMKARNARRQSDLHQLSLAVELYRTTTGHYPNGGNPNSGAGWQADCWFGGANWIYDAGNPNWSTGNISKQPVDPVDSCCWPFDYGCSPVGGPATYAYTSDGQHYTLEARLENAAGDIFTISQ